MGIGSELLIKTSVPSVASKGPYELLLRGRFALGNLYQSNRC